MITEHLLNNISLTLSSRIFWNICFYLYWLGLIKKMHNLITIIFYNRGMNVQIDRLIESIEIRLDIKNLYYFRLFLLNIYIFDLILSRKFDIRYIYANFEIKLWKYLNIINIYIHIHETDPWILLFWSTETTP